MKQVTHNVYWLLMLPRARQALSAFLLSMMVMLLPSAVYAENKTPETATVTKRSAFHVEPAGGVIRHLPANTIVQIEGRDRGWYRVKLTDGKLGYVRLASLRLGEEKASESVFTGLWSWLNSSQRSQSEMSTATAGVRGFDEADLEAAGPDHEAVKKLAGFAVGKQSAQSYAKDAALTARPVDELEGR